MYSVLYISSDQIDSNDDIILTEGQTNNYSFIVIQGESGLILYWRICNKKICEVIEFTIYYI